MNWDLWLNVIVCVLLLVTVSYCLTLNRRLSALRGAQDEMRELLQQFEEATRQAENGVSDLRRASAAIGDDLKKQVESAQLLRDELKVITQSGDELASRIEKGLTGREAKREDSQADEGPTSESERELIEALRRAR